MTPTEGPGPTQCSPEAEQWLTVHEVATCLNTSPPYVTMLALKGRLGEVRIDQRGGRQVRLSAVDALLASRPKVADGAPTSQAIALESGMYDIPESEYAGYKRQGLRMNDEERRRISERAQTWLVKLTAAVLIVCIVVATVANALFK